MISLSTALTSVLLSVKAVIRTEMEIWRVLRRVSLVARPLTASIRPWAGPPPVTRNDICASATRAAS